MQKKIDRQRDGHHTCPLRNGCPLGKVKMSEDSAAEPGRHAWTRRELLTTLLAENRRQGFTSVRRPMLTT
jgi:hypothetical protein